MNIDLLIIVSMAIALYLGFSTQKEGAYPMPAVLFMGALSWGATMAIMTGVWTISHHTFLMLATAPMLYAIGTLMRALRTGNTREIKTRG